MSPVSAATPGVVPRHAVAKPHPDPGPQHPNPATRVPRDHCAPATATATPSADTSAKAPCPPLAPNAHASRQRLDSPSPSIASRTRNMPLLTLAPSALPDEPTDLSPDEDISAIWNVISRAADVVKDGERLENLAWRHWGRPNSRHARRRSSTSTTDTADTLSVHTPSDRGSFPRSQSFEKRSFAGALKLLVEETNFKDWIEDALQHPPIRAPGAAVHTPATHSLTSSPTALAPSLSVPDTPAGQQPQFELRLVEPTPVPSRVGSLGGSGSLGSVKGAKALAVHERDIDEEAEGESSTNVAAAAARTGAPQPRRRGGRGFFIQQSPSKISGSDSSQPSQPSPVTHLPPESDRLPESPAQPVPVSNSPHRSNSNSNWRSSDDSSSAIVIKKKERRHVSLANMRGRFQSEKRQAAAGIAARNNGNGHTEEDCATAKSPTPAAKSPTPEPQVTAVAKAEIITDDDDDDWEDDDDADAAGEDESEEETTEVEDYGDGDDDDDDQWEDEESVVVQPPPAPPAPPRAAPMARQGSRGHPHPPPLPPRAATPPKVRKERAAEKARVEAERDAQRKREMFAKQQIFGAPTGATEGLLTRTFRSGKSMIDLTQMGQEDGDNALRRHPTHVQLSQLSHSPVALDLLRSKSAVAMPVESGVSVSVSQRSGRSGTSSEKRTGPEDVEMETTDEESEEDNYLASSQVQRKLDALAAKRRAKEQSRAQGAPVPMKNLDGVDLDEHGIVRPVSPTTRRRNIIMREMSESLRRNIILEREKSAGPVKPYGHARPPPSVHTSRLPTVSSAVNLAQYHAGQHGAPLRRHESNHARRQGSTQPLERHNSHPNLTSMPSQTHAAKSQSPSPGATGQNGRYQQASVSPTEPTRRRSNVLGGAFLRPLTRVGEHEIGRTKSTAALPSLTMSDGSLSPSPTAPHGHGHGRVVSTGGMSGGSSGSGGRHPHFAPAMQRSTTVSDDKELERARVKRELAKRQESTDPSYRLHGW